MTKKNERKLKLQPEYRTANTSNGLKTVPSLRLSGIWLEQSGFKAGQQVTVTVMDEELIIHPVEYSEAMTEGHSTGSKTLKL